MLIKYYIPGSYTGNLNMDADEVQNRLKILDGIKNSLEITKKNVLFILQSFGWSSQHIKNELCKRSECPNDTSHLIGSSKMKKHTETCGMGQKQYSPYDKLFPDNHIKNSLNTVVIDSELSASIIARAAALDRNFVKGIMPYAVDKRPVPLSVNQMMTMYTTDERKAIYDYVVSKTPIKDLSQLFPNVQNDDDVKYQTHKSYLEELAMVRDMKRRRTKYKVSTKAKSYTEVMREVIENQMQSHCEWTKQSNLKSSAGLSKQKHTVSNKSDCKNIDHNKPTNGSSELNTSKSYLKIRKHKHKGHKSKHKKSSKEKHSRGD
ncbi:U11/U12 small nuclear ribonucleoprotein 48 kDa protein-like [Arctopsyche grandis]|uniref:U11/U12 small nuclear ribonucleoprotein 48 kDa protein-like n=1 Tax=Arctopsyche grandis TaxID=121162 RepID=UPI00406D8811